MKKLFIIAAVTLASGGAFASKARLQALGNAAHLIDVQTMFNNPSDITLMGDWATFEMGSNGPFTYTPPAANAATTNHEGGMVRAHGDARWGFYLGHKSPTVALSRSNAWTGGAGTILNEENPIEVFYAQKADVSWGASLFYSNSDKKGPQLKQDTMGLRAGARSGAWDAYVNVGLSNNAKDSSAASVKEIKGKSAIKLAGGYTMDTMYFYGRYGMSGFKGSAAGADTADLDGSQLELGVIDTIKGEGRDFFYGVSYHMDSYKQKVGTEQKSEATYLPVIIGVEGEANSWMTLRASVTQNVLLGTIKDEIGLVTGAALTESNTWNNSTTVAAGAGLKFNKFTFDGTLGAANGGVVNTTNLLANASLTYLF
ncbi:MAG: hypothetical protein ACXVB1_04405 [Pseudobdellovibrionaceae bacterium]